MTTQPDRRVVALQSWNQANDCHIRLGTDLAAILAAADAVDPARQTLTEIRNPSDALIERVCEAMHDAYEDEAFKVGWETNPASRRSWAEVPEGNKKAMRAGVRGGLTAALLGAGEPATTSKGNDDD